MAQFLEHHAAPEGEMLALRLPEAAFRRAGSAIAQALREDGWLVPLGSQSSASPRLWRFSSVLQAEGSGLLLGPAPWRDWKSLDDCQDCGEGIALLLRFAQAALRLRGQASLPRALVSSGMLFPAGLESDEVLLLPPALIDRALTGLDAKARRSCLARLKSPLSQSAEADASFLIAQALYRLAAGFGAFDADLGDALGDVGSLAPAKAPSLAAELAAPELRPEISSVVDQALLDPSQVSLEAWIQLLGQAQSKGWKRQLSAEERSALDSRRQAAEAVAAGRKKRSAFWRRRGALVAGLSAAVVVCLLVGLDIFRAQKDRPDFSAMTSLQLTTRYYKAMDDIDLEAIESCLKDTDVAKGDYNYTMNLTVISKSRFAYEGRNPVLNAQAWVSAGKKPLTSADLLHGVSGLRIQPVSEDSSKALLRASYSFWASESSPEDPHDSSKTVVQAVEEKREDLVSLERSASWKGWRITKLDRKVLP